MTKRHFVKLADVLRPHVRTDDYGTVYLAGGAELLSDIARFCKDQNERFDRGRWFGYLTGECGPNGGAIKKSA